MLLLCVSCVLHRSSTKNKMLVNMKALVHLMIFDGIAPLLCFDGMTLQRREYSERAYQPCFSHLSKYLFHLARLSLEQVMHCELK
jgi:hypothetical protein